MGRFTFSVIGCQHAHIGIFIEQMLSLGHQCAGMYETKNLVLAETIAQKYGIPLSVDMDRLLDESVHIVGCASINCEKIDVIEMCERYGKHVMIDKPAVTNRKDLERLQAVMERRNIEVGMLLTERFRSSIYTVKKKIEAGELGEIVHISMRKPHLLKPDRRPPWHFSKEQSGGIIIDLFIHDFDLLRWLTGKEIRSVSGFMSKSILPEHPSFFDAAGLQVLLQGGISSQLYADWHTPDACWTWGDGRIFVVGTQGTAEIRLEGDPFISGEEIILQMTNEKALSRVTEEAMPLTVTEDFLNRIGGGASLLTHTDIYCATKATIEADEKAEQIYRL